MSVCRLVDGEGRNKNNAKLKVTDGKILTFPAGLKKSFLISVQCIAKYCLLILFSNFSDLLYDC